VTGFNAALRQVVNPSGRTGGTLRLARTDDFDSLDPGNCYYAYTWNFLRLFGRSLVTFAPAPGAAGQRLVPDLARSLGEPSPDARSWTYRLRPGVRFADGTPVTSQDVKRAIARSNFAPDTLAGGPSYFRQHLPDLAAIETPDPATISFHLARPFAGFDYLASLPSTVPVPPTADPGPAYGARPVATGPYQIECYRPGEHLTLVRNPAWDPRCDPVRRPRPDRIEVSLGVSPAGVDQRLLDGAAHLDLAGVGVQPQTQERILADPGLRAYADHPLIGFTWMFSIVPAVPPFGHLAARRAVMYATDKAAMREAYGGPTGGDIATTILPPTIPGHQPADRYPVGPRAGGDLPAARRELAAAGLPAGFRTRIAARADRAKELAAARALSGGLARVGIEAEVVTFPSGDYFQRYAGSPAYVREHGLGICMSGWGADFPDGLGFLQQIVDGRAVKPTGNQNLGELADPRVEALLDRGSQLTDAAERARLWAEVDRLVMDQAVICPYVHARSLLFRHPQATNVYVTGAYGMYDYLAVGVAGP
jgi:peptide/nickel transport system substrate-binding protein